MMEGSAQAKNRKATARRGQTIPAAAEEESHYATIDHITTQRMAESANEPQYSNIDQPARREPTYVNVDDKGVPVTSPRAALAAPAAAANASLSSMIFPNLPTMVSCGQGWAKEGWKNGERGGYPARAIF